MLTTESIKECVEYAEGMETKVSVENMPRKPKFLCTKPEELTKIVEETNCSVTIDLGHANTCENTPEFLEIPNRAYCHLSDNNGIKDQHTILGKGTLDLNLLKQVQNGILEPASQLYISLSSSDGICLISMSRNIYCIFSFFSKK